MISKKLLAILRCMLFVEFARRFWTFTIWSLEFLQLPPLFTFLAVSSVSLIAATWRQRPFQSPLWKSSYWLAFTQLLYFPLFIFIGILFPASSRSYLHPELIATRACDLIGLLSIASAGFWIYRMKGLRWFALSLVAVIQPILMGALFVAGMSVTGDWL